MSSFVYDKAKLRFAKGEIDLDSHTFKAVLLKNAHTPAKDTHDLLADITADEIGGTGYVTGGWALTGVTVTRATVTVKFDAADLSTPALANDFRYIAIYDDTHADDALLCLVDPGELKSPGGLVVILAWHANGICTLTDG
jgi:hypothetical protein